STQGDLVLDLTCQDAEHVAAMVFSCLLLPTLLCLTMKQAIVGNDVSRAINLDKTTDKELFAKPLCLLFCIWYGQLHGQVYRRAKQNLHVLSLRKTFASSFQVMFAFVLSGVNVYVGQSKQAVLIVYVILCSCNLWRLVRTQPYHRRVTNAFVAGLSLGVLF